jgi:pilus assembly protein Flp/PilA
MGKVLWKLLRDCTGPTAIEYGLIAALVAVVTIGGLTSIGTNLNSLFDEAGEKIPRVP